MDLQERLRRQGPSEMGDAELLAVVMGHKTTTRAAKVLDDSGGVQGLYGRIKAGHSLVRDGGVIEAALALGRRVAVMGNERPRIGGPRELATYLLPLYGHLPTERFGIVALDTKHRMIADQPISSGTLDSSLVGPREAFRAAMSLNAGAIALYHNHPSGDPTPSGDDVALTARLTEAGLIVGIEIVDHIILAGAKYCSFKEMGRM